MVDGLNVIDKSHIYQLMSNVQLPVSKTFDSQILMYSFTKNNGAILAKQYQKHLSKEHFKHGVIDQGNIGKEPVKENGRTDSIMFRIMLMFHTKI